MNGSNSEDKKLYVLKELHKLMPELKNLGVKKLGLFGSYSHNKQRPDSDIDILVEFEPGKKNIDNFMHVSFLLEDVLNQPVELVTRESLSPYIRSNIFENIEYVTNSD